jgi:hypothetical protein
MRRLITADQQARRSLCRALFCVPVIDYHRASSGLLIGSGAGIMTAIMDATQRFRFAIDLDQCRDEQDRLCAWVQTLDRNGLVDLIALAGWFSISDPTAIAATLRGLSVPTVVYSGAGLRREAFGNLPLLDTLDGFLSRLRSL